MSVQTATVERREAEDYRCDVDLTAGVHEIAAAFLNEARNAAYKQRFADLFNCRTTVPSRSAWL